MAQTKLRRNQLIMLLRKRNNIGDNELFEMMRSRDVYHVQTELRKELDRTIKALQHSEKMKITGFMTQRAMFLKKVSVLERNRQYLTNVERSIGKGGSREQHSCNSEFVSREESRRQFHLPRVGDLDSDNVLENGTLRHNKKSNINNTSLPNILDYRKSVSNDRTESVIILPSVNSEWMSRVTENSGLDSATNSKLKKNDDKNEHAGKDSSKNTKLKKNMDDKDKMAGITSATNCKIKSTVVGVNEGTNKARLQNKDRVEYITTSTDSLSKPNNESTHRIRDSQAETAMLKETITNGSQIPEHQPKKHNHSRHRYAVAHNTLIANPNLHQNQLDIPKDGNSDTLSAIEEEGDVLKQLPLIKHKRYSKPQTLISVILDVESKKATYENTELSKETNSTPASPPTAEIFDEPKEQPSHSGCDTDSPSSPPKHITSTHDKPATQDTDSERIVDGKMDSSVNNLSNSDSSTDVLVKTNPYTENQNEPKVKNQAVTRSLTSVEPYLGRSRRDEDYSIKQKPSEAVTENKPCPTDRKPQVAPKLPFLRRTQSHPHIANRSKTDKNLAYLNLAGNLERTVTMVFVEDPSFHRDPPKSLFDFEAWLAYNRRKRGYTKILDDKLLSEGDKTPIKKKGGKKRKSTNRVRFSISKSANVESESKSFRQKSKEWYLNFLQLRNSAGNSESREEREKIRRYSMAVKAGLTFLPRIGLNTSDKSTSGEVTKTPAEQFNNMLFSNSSSPKMVRETTEQKLKRVKDETKGLQVKVQHFISSPDLFRDHVEH